jgi:hypothetical protein
MWVKLAAQLSHRGQLAPTPPVHCIPLRNAMPGMAGVPAQPADPSVVPAARSSGRGCGWWQCAPKPQSPPVDMWTTRRTLPTYPQAQHQPKLSDSLLAQGSDSTPDGGCERFAVSRVLEAPHAAKPGRMTRFHRGVPRRHCPARNMNEADRSRATKTGHID